MPVGAEDAIAQSKGTDKAAATAPASDEFTAEASEKALQRLKRRYIPRFVGKREQDSAEAESEYDKTDDKDLNSDTEEELTDFDEQDLLDYFEKMGETEILNDLTQLEKENDLHVTDEDGSEYMDNEDGDFDESMDIERRRYVPSFVGKRYNPMFVGKRYSPMFVGKKYSPMFVGKRYIPRFVGKRYIPRFVGKRYRPMFIGKRKSPMFIGKRYKPMFVGKRYKPMFVGKKNSVIPRFIGKRDPSPIVVDERRVPMFLGKRSVSEEQQPYSSEIEAIKDEEVHSRKKRSLMVEDDNDLKRAWGTYVPWQDMPTYKMLQGAAPDVEKRFVAPEFIGRRDSLTSLLSALKALRYARNEPRIASKRFQAPLFIGKRDEGASENALLKYYRLRPLSDGNYELIAALDEMSGKLE